MWEPWERRVAAVHEEFDKPVIFLEAGYRQVADAHREPWLYEGGDPSPDQQARAYDALFTVWTRHDWWHGVYLWKAFTDPRRCRPEGGWDGVYLSERRDRRGAAAVVCTITR